MDGSASQPRAVLFVCALNSVRSPMAAALLRQMAGEGTAVASAGVHKDTLDPFAAAAMMEAGIDITGHEPMTIEELEDLDSQILTSDLPIDAYLDRGFQQWLTTVKSED